MKTIIELFRIKVVEPLQFRTREEREESAPGRFQHVLDSLRGRADRPVD
jgi:hypothetical protein